MKIILNYILIGCMAVLMLTGCGSNKVENTTTADAVIEDGDISAKTDKVADGNIASLLGKTETDSPETKEVVTVATKGEYDAIFANEIRTQLVNENVSIVISGYEFAVDDDTYCTYFSSVGPAFVIGDEVQYKIKVQDRTNEEIKKIDVTEKLVSQGGEVVSGPETIVDNGLEYIVFEYKLQGERGVAVNMPGPDPDHAIGVQLALMNDTVDAKEAVKAALKVARTAKVTSAPDTTEDEIKNIYGNSWVSGTSMASSTMAVGGKTYEFSVPSGFKFTSEDIDEDMGVQCFSNGEISVTVSFMVREYSDSKNYMDNMWAWNYADVKSDTSVTADGQIAYGTYEWTEYGVYGVDAAKVIKGLGSVLVEGESKSKLTLDDIVGFYGDETPKDSGDNSIGGPKTTVRYDQIYMGIVDDADIALDIIAEYGRRQKGTYSDSEVAKIEQNLEDRYSIAAVNLGEMDIETARDVEKAVSYMFDTYPIIKGSLNTISLANLNRDEATFTAVTRTVDFVIRDEVGDVPKVVRNEILLNASKWLNRDKMLAMCKENVNSGYWFKNANDPSKVVVHELGHQLLNVLRAREYNFSDIQNGENVYMPCLITEEKKDAYIDYYWSGTAMNQEFDSKLMEAAYKEWKSMGHSGSEEDFRSSISQYAKGIKSDGGVSLHETFAEAVADVYCNGDNASDASKAIMKQVK